MPGRGQKDLFERLIREVKVRESLYNIRHPNYKDRHNTDVLWEEVAHALGMTVMDVKRLWGTLRSSYTRSVKGSMCSASRKVSPWYLEEEMEFLRPHLQLCLPGGKKLPAPQQDFYAHKPKEENIVKLEEIPHESYERKDLEDGEILPEDLVPGAYWITPQFPKRIGASETYSGKDSLHRQFASSSSTSVQIGESSSECDNSQDKNYITSSMYPGKKTKLEVNPSADVSFNPMAYHMERDHNLERIVSPCTSRNDNIHQEYNNVKNEESDNEFFKGILPRYKELSKKNKRKFEMQTVHLLYSILDEQEEEST